MAIPEPSRVRVVHIYPGGRGPNMTLQGSNALKTWPALNPLSTEWNWINASLWCEDIKLAGGQPETIAQVGVQILGGDGKLQLISTTISSDGQQAGLLLSNASPEEVYVVRVRLTAEQSFVQTTIDIRLPVSAMAPVVPINPNAGTINRDALTVGGIPIFARAPS